MSVFVISLVIFSSVLSSVVCVPYLWWNVIFAEGGFVSLEAILATLGTLAFWGGSFVAFARHDVQWLWAGEASIATAVVGTSLLQRRRHRH
jgi:hypothetical protein